MGTFTQPRVHLSVLGLGFQVPTPEEKSSAFLAARRTFSAPYGAPEIWLIRVTYGAIEPVSWKKGGSVVFQETAAGQYIT